jgi:hypothetical protein
MTDRADDGPEILKQKPPSAVNEGYGSLSLDLPSVPEVAETMNLPELPLGVSPASA